MPIKTLALLAVIFTAVIWGVSVPLMKVLLVQVPPFSLAFLRFFIASLIALSLSQAAGLKLVDFAKIGILALFGITINIGLLFLGLSNAHVVDVSVLLALSPIITIAMAVIFANEKINFIHRVGILVSFIGAFLYFVLPHFFSASLPPINFQAQILVFISIISLTIYTIGIKRLFSVYKVTQISSVSFLVGAFSFLPPASVELAKNPDWYKSLSLFSLFGILFVGIFTSFVAYTLLEWGLSKLPIHVNSIVSYLAPLIAIVVSALFLNEPLTWLLFISAPLIGLGIFLTTYSKHHHHPRIHKV